jgi:ABC-type branched-subunit amino acid transport system substrate-binding protein
VAIDEINASGGVLGQKLQLTQYDIESNFTPTDTNQLNTASVDACP